MNLVDLLKKNIVMVPIVASLVVGTFTGVRYIVNLTDTIDSNNLETQLLWNELLQQENVSLQSQLIWWDSLHSLNSNWQIAQIALVMPQIYLEKNLFIRKYNYLFESNLISVGLLLFLIL